METYKSRLVERSKKELRKNNISKYVYQLISEYIESNYKNNRDGFLSYLENMFFKKAKINLEEYNKLIDLAYKVKNVRKK